jgi:hypothetical protein
MAAGGNIFLTGHDTDLHMFYGSASANAAMIADLAFVRNGSALPVLTFDAGGELTGDLTALGVPFTNINPSNAAAITAGLFDHTKYSAIAVASITSCGGCDNTPQDNKNIAAQAAAIASFFNAGGGVLGFAGAQDTTAYGYVPDAAANAGGFPPSTGFVETAAGTAAGLVAENGDPTHNYFGTPGVGGLSSAYTVAEVNGTNNESIFVKNGTITCTGSGCVIHTGTGSTPAPEPVSLSLLGVGLFGLGLARRRRRH